MGYNGPAPGDRFTADGVLVRTFLVSNRKTKRGAIQQVPYRNGRHPEYPWWYAQGVTRAEQTTSGAWSIDVSYSRHTDEDRRTLRTYELKPRTPIYLWALLGVVWLALYFMLPKPARGQTLPTTAPATQPTVKYVGVYTQRARDLAFWASKGINLAVHWESESGNVTQAQWRQAARDAGLYYIDTYLSDGDVTDPNLIGWLLKDSDEWNRARGNPPYRPDPAPFIEEAKRLALLNATAGANKIIMANADGPGVTTAIFEKPPYNGIKNGEMALLPFLTGRSIDWYPVVGTASTQPSEIARRPMHLPAQAVWRLRTWSDAAQAQPATYAAIIEAAKNHRAPLGVTPAQMREQVDYLIGNRPFPVPDANAKPVQFQGKLVDIIVWWTANGQDGPGWKWIASTDEQLAALEEITRSIKTPPAATQPSTRPTEPTLAEIRVQFDALQAAFDAQTDLVNTLRTNGADLKTRLDVLQSNTAAAVADLKAQSDAQSTWINAVRAAATQPSK